MTRQCDKLGRRNRLKPVSTGKRITPQERDLHWFAKLAEHGPLPSSFLLEYAKATHRSEKRSKERLTDLFNEDQTPHDGAYFARPLQQFRTIDSRYNQLVYDLAPASQKALSEIGLPFRPARSGPWLHSLMVGCITASVELACIERCDINFIPQSAIMARAEADLRWPTKITDPKTGAEYVKDLLPDAVFGLEYLTEAGSRFRFFAVEADRATEPFTSSNFHRKSFERHLLQYQGYIERGGYKEHLALTAPMLVLNVLNDKGRMDRQLRCTSDFYPDGCSFQLFQCWDEFGAAFRPPTPNPEFLLDGWMRAGNETLKIC